MVNIDHVEIAEGYASDVIAGRVPACKYVKQAAKRHLSDRKKEARKDLRYRFNPELVDTKGLTYRPANRICQFVERLPHTKGKWALGKLGVARTNLIKLEPWQCFILCCVFGWVRKEDGKRRFRIAYVEVPRKNGKSHLAAAIGLYMLAADGEFGAEVYSGATTEKQAHEVFRPAKQMAERTPAFLSYYDVGVNASNLNVLATGSRFEPVIGKPGDGASPSCAIVDEFHEHATDELYDTMLTGMGAREQPLMFVITTAGSDTSGPCYALRTDTLNVLAGTTQNDELFGIVWTLDEGDDWTKPEALRKANPNYGVSVDAEFLEARQKEAIQSSRRQSTFRTKHLNIWVSAASPWMNMEWWHRQADPTLREANFIGEPVWVGGDLASKLDIASTIKVFRRDDDLYIFGRHYLPESRVEEVERYRPWVLDGLLVTTPGDYIDHGVIRDDLLEDAERYRWVAGGFDSYNATQLIVELNQAIGREDAAIAVPQTVAHLSEPMKWLEALTKAGRIHHDGNDAMNWMISNVTAFVDRKDNIFPRKERPENKIDGAVALIIAIGRALSCVEEGSDGVYLTVV